MNRKEFVNKKRETFSYLTNLSDGEGLVFLFFHATGFNGATYKNLLNKLDKKFDGKINIIALDQRGHGFTEAMANPNDLRSWDCYVEDASEFVNSLEGKVVCAGHSMGAVIAAKLAALKPKRIPKLIMIDPVLWSPLESFKFRFMSKINFHRKISLADSAAKRRKNFLSLEDAMDSYRGRGAFATWEDMWIKDYLEGGTIATSAGIELTCSPLWESMTFKSSSMDTWQYLKKVKTPSYIPCGEKASTFSFKARRALLKLGVNWEIEEYKQATHFLPMEYSHKLIDRIHDFMSK
tara:strand:+ start:32380 stop:33258 length:879 start_codon:yes stop_codon:yes gene_type:complete